MDTDVRVDRCDDIDDQQRQPDHGAPDPRQERRRHDRPGRAPARLIPFAQRRPSNGPSAAASELIISLSSVGADVWSAARRASPHM
jgi:hypothetical protein